MLACRLAALAVLFTAAATSTVSASPNSISSSVNAPSAVESDVTDVDAPASPADATQLDSWSWNHDVEVSDDLFGPASARLSPTKSDKPTPTEEGGNDPIPEPTTLALLGLGLAGMALRKRSL